MNTELLSYTSLKQACLRHSDKTTSHIHKPSEHIWTGSDCAAKITTIVKSGNTCLENIKSCEFRFMPSSILTVSNKYF